MLTYEKLPPGTPRWVTIVILLLGGALGLSISAEALLGLYGLSAFVHNLFFPLSAFSISVHEAAYLGCVGASAILSGTLLSFLAIYMNRLSHKAISMSRIVWIPVVLTAALVYGGRHIGSFIYGFPMVWLIGSCASILLGGVLPWLVLRNADVQKVHRR